MKKDIEAKIIKPHIDGCSALKNYKSGFWDTPWAYIIDEIRLDSLGRKHKHGACIWHVVRCNDINCTAQKIIKNDAIMKIGEGADG